MMTDYQPQRFWIVSGESAGGEKAFLGDRDWGLGMLNSIPFYILFLELYPCPRAQFLARVKWYTSSMPPLVRLTTGYAQSACATMVGIDALTPSVDECKGVHP